MGLLAVYGRVYCYLVRRAARGVSLFRFYKCANRSPSGGKATLWQVEENTSCVSVDSNGCSLLLVLSLITVLPEPRLHCQELSGLGQNVALEEPASCTSVVQHFS